MSLDTNHLIRCPACCTRVAPGRFCSHCGTALTSFDLRPARAHSFSQRQPKPAPRPRRPTTTTTRSVKPHRKAPPPPTPYAEPRKNVAVEHAECIVCFEPLCAQPCVGLSNNGKRVCWHYYHKGCVFDNLKSCPICRAPFNQVTELPPLHRNPKKWFDTVDVDGNGSLECAEVISALKCTLHVDWRQLEKDISANWYLFDPDGDGRITFEELNRAGGLIDWIKQKSPSVARLQPPSITNKASWFDFWDEDHSGELDKEETTRAIIKTLGIADQGLNKIQEMRGMVEAIWQIFDIDGGGGIDRDEFLVPNTGLADTLIASTNYR